MRKYSKNSILVAVFAVIAISSVLILPRVLKAADDIIQLTADGVSQSDQASKARADSLKNAIDKACLQVITDLIGQSKFEKNESTIRSKILSQTSKFVQYYKASEPVKTNADTITSVTLKISMTSLRELLATEGLLYQSEGPATVLPVIRFVDKKTDRDFRWWVEEAKPENMFMREQAKQAGHILDAALRKNFYVMDPIGQHYVQWLPQGYKQDNPGNDELMWMGEFYRGQIIIFGEVGFDTSSSNLKMTTKLTAMHSGNGRVIADVVRSFELPASDWDFSVSQAIHKQFPEVTKELASQVFEAWSRGSLGSTLLTLSLKGPLNYQDIESFKKQMLSRIGDVKTIRERRLESGMTTFEIDAAGGMTNLVKRIEATAFEGFRVKVDDLDSTKVSLRWAKVGKN